MLSIFNKWLGNIGPTQYHGSRTNASQNNWFGIILFYLIYLFFLMFREEVIKRLIAATLLLLPIVFVGCSEFEYSPNQIFNKSSYQDINEINLRKLGDGQHDDTVRFVLTGDTQRSHSAVSNFYKKINTMSGIDFVVVAGDITEFGNLKEMEWVAERLNKLNIPYVAVIGNHDLTSRGREAFQRMYGKANYSFVYGGVKFICHDTNSREYQFDGQVPNIPWLKNQLRSQADVSSYVAISHVPPTSSDFDENLVDDYSATFGNATGFLTSFHAHNHVFEEFRFENFTTPYVTTNAIGSNEFLLVEIVNKKLSFEQISF
ncbi:metallophosphoesterase family protein [Sphingobacterium sp. SG20118]|uniref:metallophosphoesterase family protein n=1 Tax=Sphingobacterium sp. SG20118 TaxID=3367156 RepID=UPI0037DFBED6